MAGLRKKRPTDGPRQRYGALLRRGMASGEAARRVAEDYGLAPNVVAGQPPSPDLKWTIAEVERLLALKWEFVHGLGGELDGVGKYPQYRDGFVQPP